MVINENFFRLKSIKFLKCRPDIRTRHSIENQISVATRHNRPKSDFKLQPNIGKAGG